MYKRKKEGGRAKPDGRHPSGALTIGSPTYNPILKS